MSTPILATKFYVPTLRPTAILRPRLVDRLNAGLHRKLTLIAAPAGSGKTTLVSEWLTGPNAPHERKVAWLSLDEGVSDPVRFLTYVVAALRTAAPTFGEGVLGALQAPQPPPSEALLAALLNEIAATPGQIVLVLDDYHLIDAAAIDDALAFLVEHLPPQLHLVIATREDPRLPLARLRARDQLTEVRGLELRFTPSEAADFLRAMNLELSAEDVAALERRTEGWVAGLQLAALSMQGQQDVSGFIRAFAGDHRYIVDYLVEEVLQRQPAAVRSFLLQTAILDELRGPLCDAVTGQAESQARLLELERSNFFVVPLDDKRQWYRYHHLFADVLRVHLLAEQPALVPLLHQRASVWYAQHAMLDAAIRHALAAEDFSRVADLIEPAIPALGRSREGTKVLGWLRALPDELVRSRPVLCVGYAWALMTGGELAAMEPWLREAEQWLERNAALGARPAAMIVVDEVEFRRLPAMIAIYRAGRAQLLGNARDTMHYARQALASTTEEDYLGRGAATALLGLAAWSSGDLETAYRTYAEGMARVRLAGNISDVITSTIALADIRIAQGRLREAITTYEQALQLATRPGEPTLQGTAELYVGLSELKCEQNDLDAARQYLVRGEELSERTRIPQDRYRGYRARARLKQAEGDLEGALALLHEAERVYVRDFFPNVRPAAALMARIWLLQGRLGEALGWARAQGLSARDELSYLREFEHSTLARVLLAHYRRDRVERSLADALGLLERLLYAADAGGRMGSVLEISLLQALAYHAQGDSQAARLRLQHALMLAEAEGYVRIFVDEGPPMQQLLEEAAKTGSAPADYVRQLLAAFGKAEETPPDHQNLVAWQTAVIEPLSERELEVLRLLRTDLSGPEMARQLIVSPNTLHTHTKNIYSKLGVNNRRAAVRRAEELGLY